MVVYVRGYLNGALGKEVCRVVRGLVDAGELRLLINFEGTRLINSRGIASILALGEMTAERDGRLALCALTPAARDLFRVTGTGRTVAVFETEGDALASFGLRG